jgi:probable F420-dependent oxidoreductase
MTLHRPFRFGAAWDPESRKDLIEGARKLEALGYDTMVLGEHPSFGGLAPLPTLMAAAMATTTLRFATHVLANDFHNPVLLAQEAATLDLLSDGRFELGLGTGWTAEDYTSLGIAHDGPGERVSRLAEAVGVIKRLLSEERVTHTGKYYQVQNAVITPKPGQHVPLVLGGGGKRILGLAAREADIVSIDPIGTADGKKDFSTISAEAVAQQIGWIRDAAGERFDTLELHMLYGLVSVTDDRRQAAEQIIAFLNNAPPIFVNAIGKSVEEVLASPRCLIGSIDQIIADIQMRRERYGISYITVLEFPGMPSRIEALAPVVARLAGN